MAAPANPPISVCEDEEGIPSHHVRMFQDIAAISPERIIGRVMYCSSTTLETVLAIPNSPIIYFATKNAKKLNVAAHITACTGDKTRVVTTVAIELAASWKPFMKSKMSPNAITIISNVI